ncbi:MAG: HlyD family efflux transporter periplasmic adaptor subunit [Cytophagales bacterium]|nr:HlyD family efflux transporter periplasmic adaptor subunit [Cytophagales bacterium]
MEKFKSFNEIYLRDKGPRIKPWLIGLGLIVLGILFLPWTQNIKSRGNITSLFQEQKPQKIFSPIAGKMNRWWVKEGDFVNQGDTLAKISEIKAEYLDPKLISRTEEQLDAKKGTVGYYEQKVKSTEDQIVNLRTSKKLKQDQLANKITQLQQKLTGERSELDAAGNEYNLVKDQFERNQKMFKEGLISQTTFQQRDASMQNALAKKTIAENKVNQTLQEIQNTKIELRGVDQEYSEKMNKAESDKFQSLGMIETGKGEIAKLENQVANYTIRDGMYYILAPQSGQIINAQKAGIGEILKDGEELLTIVPTNTNYAVEMYVRPVDLPLVMPGQDVRFIFDGFPAILFAGGWPEQSFGTFAGKVKAVENNIDEQGMFRVIVVENPKEKKWPKQIKMGAGAKGIALLNDVPLWYELWRNINGFPADFYTVKKDEK